MATSFDTDGIATALTGALTDAQVSVGSGDRKEHSKDASSHAGHLPDIVVWPHSTEDVQAVVRIANAGGIPLTAWGAGTSVEGNPIPAHGGIVMDFREMNRILEIHANDFQVTVEPGVLYKDMNRELGRQGLFFAPDPGANASIGGMVANNAAGIRTVKYGATRDNVLALEVLLANGEIVQTGSRSTKQSSGYDLTHLIVGSEGTLGIVTKATLRLHPIPEHYSAAIAAFPTVEDAAQTVYEIAASGLDPNAMEILDTYCIELINRAESLDWDETPTLIMEFSDASTTPLIEKMKTVEDICADNHCTSFSSGVGRNERERLWEMRHGFFELLVRSHPGKTWLLSDICVPVSQFPTLVHRARELSEEFGTDTIIFGHAGDGNIHTTNFYDPNAPTERDAVMKANHELQRFALSLGGTSTGEHGIGLGKLKYMESEHGASAVQLMRDVKELFDPKGILNPGKILPD
ncbi:MAG: FAD-linked oxidase C-terminal domain-containing protein [Candidatus Hydrogenedentota bacterium]